MGSCCPKIGRNDNENNEEKDLNQPLLSNPENNKISVDSFKILKVNFEVFISPTWCNPSYLGKVLLQKSTSSKRKITVSDKPLLFSKPLLEKRYAMKVVNKVNARRRRQVMHSKREREILASMECPFIVTLHYAFQTESKLYMVIDFMPGGKRKYTLKNTINAFVCRRVICSFKNCGQVFRGKSQVLRSRIIAGS